MFGIGLLVCSVLLQAIVIYSACRLIAVTGKQAAWICISAALVLMIVRRLVVLHGLLAGEIYGGLDLSEEVIAVAVSILLLMGISAISPIFRGLRSINEELVREIGERKRAQEQSQRLIVELEQALGQVKTLRGLLPICASCKKIRDDNGYWTQIEAYVRDRSEAEFSHGLCPECAEKLYPEYVSKTDEGRDD